MGKTSSRSGKRFNGDGNRFIALPHVVLQSEAFISLSHPARSLLIEIAYQFAGNNNGQLRASRAFLGPRGWKSNDTITKARNELIDAALIFQTVKGHRPNKASWFALTWYDLDKDPRYDAGTTSGFERGAYKRCQIKNTIRGSPDGAKPSPIAPPDGYKSKP